ncbi:hypothetical protein [Williamsia phyllosphaerae]|uniref:DUF4232 domain-containing protein n=1 Tax=Williamsia phyllosphaerae TaxID=885042 RepID=A0ABQ1UP46_9NOCA|nr:hypothetical protein [Williamsia phyllosphaerae]GGF21897.1 hypothetical protein GCM10007298_17320 [Williamsia phyllosphaerae]
MLEPQGPLPPEIYWRRRALAVGVVVLVVVVIVGIIVLATGGSGDKPTNTSASLSTSPSSTQLPESIDPSQSGVTGGGGSGGGSAAPSSSGAPASSSPSSSGAPQSSQAPGAVPASGLCPDQNISVVLYTDKPSYTTGEKPTFTLVVTNAGLTECTRDVGKDMQNVTVRSLDGTRYIWSATDCSPINTVNNQLLKPAQQFKDTIVWSGTTSAPGCKLPRVQAGAGPYQAVGELGQRQSAPITFNFTNPPGA